MYVRVRALCVGCACTGDRRMRACEVRETAISVCVRWRVRAMGLCVRCACVCDGPLSAMCVCLPRAGACLREKSGTCTRLRI